MKTRKILRIVGCVLLAGVLALVGAIVYTDRQGRSAQLSAAVGMATPASLYAESSVIVEVRPTGGTQRFAGGGVRFRLAEVNVENTLRGETAGAIRLLQTEGLEANPQLKAGQRYLLFLEPYAYNPDGMAGMEKAEGAYAIEGAFKGVYALDADGNLSALRTSYETEEQTAQREQAMRELWTQIQQQS